MDAWINFPWNESLLLCTIIITGLSGLVLLMGKAPSGRWLGVVMQGYVLGIVLKVAFSDQYLLPTLVTILAAHYLYYYAFFHQRTRISAIHFLLVLGAFAVVHLLSQFNWVVIGINGLILFGYFIRILRLLNEEATARGFSYFSNPGARIAWLRNFVLLNMLCLIVIGLSSSHWIIYGMVLLLVAMVLYQLIQESSFLTPIPLGNKYKKSTLSPEIKATILDRIEEVLVKQQFYKRDDASLTSLADELGVTTHHLSQVLNESLMISFQDLIARYRVREACRLLRDESHAQVKIENVANLVGYNSKSAFNTAFKKRTGLTPSEYREAKDVRSYGEERLSERKEPSNDGSSFSLNHVFNLKIRNDMILHFFKIFGRNIKRNGIFTLLNVLGLTIAFSCAILIYLYVQDELSYDRSLPDSERIYRIAWRSDNPQTRTPHPLAQALVHDFPEVEAAVSLSPWYGPGLSKDKVKVKNVTDNIVFEEPDFYFADSTFLDIFQLKVVEGDPKALSKPFAFVISEPMAKKYFGDESAIGQEMTVNDMPLTVSAVVDAMPPHSHFHFNGIIPYVTLKQINPNSNWMTWADFGHFNYIKLREDADVEKVESKIPNWVLGYLNWDQTNREILLSGEYRFELQPITSIHLHSNLRWELENNGNVLYVYILLIVLAFLLVIAAINYTNLTTAKSVERAKEIGVRKTLGAISTNLSIQFYLESILFSLMAMIFSQLIVLGILESFNGISGKSFSMDDLLNVSFVTKAVSLSVMVGILAGFYPAIALSSYKPTEVLKGKLTSGSRGVRLRSALVVLQFSISAILISGSLIIFRQIQFIQEKDLGFDKEAIISLTVPISVEKGGVDLERLRSTQNQLEAISGVRATALTSSMPGGQFNQHAYFLRNSPENRVDVSEIMVDYGIEEVLGLETVAGRMFDKSISNDSLGGVIINEAFASQLEVDDPIGMTLVQDASGREYESKIIGIIKNFHFQSLHSEIQPLMMAVQPLGAGNILVKLEGYNFSEVISQIQEVYEKTIQSELPFEYVLLDQELARMYEQEERTLSIFSVFSLVALFLASLGLLGMAIAIMNQRVKEVGMRKIMGATNGQIMWMILEQFLRLILVAVIIGLPIAYLFMQRWIQEFSYQVPFGIMPFLMAIVILLSVAIVSVVSAVAKITYANPVDALRYE